MTTTYDLPDADETVAPEPCHQCGRTDLPLHVDYRCPACHAAASSLDAALSVAEDRSPLDMLDTTARIAAAALNVVRSRIGVLVAQREAINAEVKALRLDAERLERMVRAAGHDVDGDPNPEAVTA